ncbi:adenine phosphoribosyltransferase [Corynebacterium sp.]|uniref:adenine phosphoribosyltransferase n=1 Tax=Corynebacterium sp. TaxID=1720 RepID=UPI0026DBBEDF|nr:adenine phosphoribosyltransferase [Corynebacterium sp.]MDO5077555.1 adenine phosphoribosyltransferase [Corynebacterium sp.]
MSYTTAREALAHRMRYVEGFPVEGVLFEDLTPVLADAEAFKLVIDELAAACEAFGADMIAGLDARGFLLGSAVAYKMGLGILAVRKQGKLPPPVHTQEYALEYGTAALQVPASGIPLEGRRIVLVDDVLATGGTLIAARKLLERCGASVVGHAVALEVQGLGGRQALAGLPLTVINSQEDSSPRG